MKTYPFNKQLAQLGWPALRDGQPMRIICFDRPGLYPIVAHEQKENGTIHAFADAVGNGVRFIGWEETENLKLLEYSTDLKTWKPCTKEAK